MRPAAMFRFKIGSSLVQTLQDLESCPARPQRCVLIGCRRAKHGHDAIAGKPLHYTALLTDAFAHQLGETSHHGKGGFFSRLFGEGGEAHHVCEKDGDLSALSFYARPQDAERRNLAQRNKPQTLRDVSVWPVATYCTATHGNGT